MKASTNLDTMSEQILAVPSVRSQRGQVFTAAHDSLSYCQGYAVSASYTLCTSTRNFNLLKL